MPTDGFMVVCEEDGILFGHGDTPGEAFKDAREWILDALRDQLQAELQYAQEKDGRTVCVDLTWKAHPATAALRESLGSRGGHDDWHKRSDGALDLGRVPPASAEGGAGGD